MEIKDLAGLSAPLTKLIEVISAGVGKVSESYFIKNRAKAKAEEITLISDALYQASQENNLPVEYINGEINLWSKPEDSTLVLQNASIEQRSTSRLDYQERKRQDNIENITSAAAVELVHETTVPDKKINEDWISRFFESAQAISSQQMQELWGRILAGEIKKPGSYSLKALDLIRNLSKTDASLIEKMGKFSLFSPAGAFIDTTNKKWLKDEREIQANHHFQMAELGLLYPTDLYLNYQIKDESDATVFEIGNGNFTLSILSDNIKKEINQPIWKYTAIGQELLGLVPNHYDQDYFIKIGQYFLRHGGKASIVEKTVLPESGITRYTPILEIDQSM